MPRKKASSLTDEIAKHAVEADLPMEIIHGKEKMLLFPSTKVNIKGNFVWIHVQETKGLYHNDGGGELQPATAAQLAEAEGIFFPERKQELDTLKELAAKYGWIPKAESAPREKASASSDDKPKQRRTFKDAPVAIGEKFQSVKDGLVYTVEAVNHRELTMKSEEGSLRKITYSGGFMRGHKKVD